VTLPLLYHSTNQEPRLSVQSEKARRNASAELDPERRATLGQFMTPAPIADFMASLFRTWPREIALLEPGAGVGALAEAFGHAYRKCYPTNGALAITAYELEPSLAAYFGQHLHALEAGGGIRTEIILRDFIRESSFASSFGAQRFTHVIMNPPYKKIGSQSEYRRLLSSIGAQTGNLYTAFLALAVQLMREGGELVAIIPRSFCNGMYFRPFRNWLLDRVAITQIHVFESRSKAFSDDDVLQENIIVRLEKGAGQGPVVISTSDGGTFETYAERTLPFDMIVKPRDPERYIHIPTFEIQEHPELFTKTLKELGLDIATGPVVDFRLREHSLPMPTDGSVPLLYAHHFVKGAISWPREHRKPNALVLNESTRKWLMPPRGWYTIMKRFSSPWQHLGMAAHPGASRHTEARHSPAPSARGECARPPSTPEEARPRRSHSNAPRGAHGRVGRLFVFHRFSPVAALTCHPEALDRML